MPWYNGYLSGVGYLITPTYLDTVNKENGWL